MSAPLFGSQGEQRGARLGDEADPPTPVLEEVRPDETRMQGIGGDPRPLEPSGELVGEHDVGQLGLLVGPPSAVTIPALKVVEGDFAPSMGIRGHIDDPAGALAVIKGSSNLVSRK